VKVVLDTGELLKIAAFAENAIHPSDLAIIAIDNPQGDIEVVFPGLHSGENLL